MTQRVNDAELNLWANKAAVQFLRERYGWTGEAILDAHIGLEGDRFLFPSQDLDGAWYYTTRQWTGEGPKYKHELPAPQLYLPKPIGIPVVLCEGHTDTVTALNLGMNAMGLMGVSTVNNVLPRLASYPYVNIIMDADKAGWKATRALVTGLLETNNTAISVTFLLPPEKIGKWVLSKDFGEWYSTQDLDLTDYVKQYGADAARLCAASGIGGPAIRILKNPPPPAIRTSGPGRTDIDIGKLLHGLTCGNRCPCEYAARRGWGAVHCPAHSDSTPSFSVKENDGRVLVHCFSGCTQESVIDALRERNLWPKYEPKPHANSTGRGASNHRSDSRFSRPSLLAPRVPPTGRFLPTREPRSLRSSTGNLGTRW